jgi:hypothetical protein
MLRYRGKKVIYDVHEDVPRQISNKNYISNNFRYLISRMTESLENIASRRFDGVVAATPLIYDRFLKIGCHVTNTNNFPILGKLNIPENDWNQKERAESNNSFNRELYIALRQRISK